MLIKGYLHNNFRLDSHYEANLNPEHENLTVNKVVYTFVSTYFLNVLPNVFC